MGYLPVPLHIIVSMNELMESERLGQKLSYIIWKQINVGTSFSNLYSPLEIITGVSAEAKRIGDIILAQKLLVRLHEFVVLRIFR